MKYYYKFIQRRSKPKQRTPAYSRARNSSSSSSSSSPLTTIIVISSVVVVVIIIIINIRIETLVTQNRTQIQLKIIEQSFPINGCNKKALDSLSIIKHNYPAPQDPPQSYQRNCAKS